MTRRVFKLYLGILFISVLIGCKKKDEGGTVYIMKDPPTNYYHSSVMCPYIHNNILTSKAITKLKALEDKKIPCEYCYTRLELDLHYMRGTYKELMKDDEDEPYDDEFIDEGVYPDDKTDIRRFPY